MKYHPICAGVSYIPGVSTQGKSILAPNVWHAGACWLVEANKLISGIKSFSFQIPSPLSALAGESDCPMQLPPGQITKYANIKKHV